MNKWRLKKHERLLFAIPLVLFFAQVLRFALPINVFAAIDPSGDALDRAIRRKVGYAQDCGTVPVGGNVGAANACAISAFKAKRAFRVRYDVPSTSAKASKAIAGTKRGEVYFFDYTSDGDNDGSNSRELATHDLCDVPYVSSKNYPPIGCGVWAVPMPVL